MKVTHHTKRGLAIRRDEKRMLAAGYERVGDNGGKLWELNRGWRFPDYFITDVKIAACGRELWVKIEPQPRSARSFSAPEQKSL